MTDDPVVTIAATARAWASRLHAHAVDHGGAVVRATVIKAADAIEEASDVLLIDDVSSFLTPHLVMKVRQAGHSVLGMYDAEDPQGKSVLVDAGVDALMPIDAEPDELIGAIRNLAAQRPLPVGEPVDQLVAGTRAPVAEREGRGGLGRRTVVLGAGGGTGCSEIALLIADAHAQAGRAAVLIDADELSPSLAQRLRLPLHPNVRTAIDAVLSGGDLAPAAQVVSRRRPLSVIPGFPVPGDFALLRSGALTDTVDAVARRVHRVVIDVGQALEPAETMAGRRYGHAAGLLERCDDAVLVAAPTPVGLSRAARTYAELSSVVGVLHLVLNRCPSGRFQRREAVAELRRATGVSRVHCLPEDPAVGRAGWEGVLLTGGKLTRSVAKMVSETAGSSGRSSDR